MPSESKLAVCVCRQLTPAGRGAVASVEVRGPDAVSRVAEFFQPAGRIPLADRSPRTPLFGTWKWNAVAAPEEVVVCVYDAEWVEVHGHGGRESVRAILSSLAERGCEWRTDESLDDIEPLDLIAREAVAALAECRTARAALLLLAQYRGALRDEWTAIAERERAGETRAACQRIDALLSTARIGLRLTRPWSIALAGEPNVGKSSLANALIGFERAIVNPLAGTTRDVLLAETAIDGWAVELADTAGLRDATDGVEREGIRRARQAHDSADLVLAVVDATSDWTERDEQWLASYPDALVVRNKIDLTVDSETLPPLHLSQVEVVEVSALTGAGIERLWHAIRQRLVPNPPPPGSPLVFTERQQQELEAWRRRLVDPIQRHDPRAFDGAAGRDGVS